MKTTIRTTHLLVTLALLVAALGPTTAAPAQAARLHPAVAQLAAGAPAQLVRVVVQKADASDTAETLVARLGGAVTKDLHIINAFSAEMTAQAARELAASASVRWISPDGAVATSGKGGGTTETSQPANYFLDTLRVREVWATGIKGTGIGVAVIDSGVAADADFGNRLVQVSVNPGAKNAGDLTGHGTHVAGIIGGSGAYPGIAPAATLISLCISDDQGLASESDAVAAMQWVLENKATYNIRVVNLSINSAVEQSYHSSPLSAAAEILWFNGIVVVAASGNWEGGAYNPVRAAPANDPFVITVGATSEKGNARPQDDAITRFTALGTTPDGYAKPEIFAPGTDIISVLSANSRWSAQHAERVVAGEYFRLSGTSMAAPMVSGAVALLLQSEPTLTPDQVKYRLLKTNRWVSGGRYLNVYALLTTPTTAAANVGAAPNRLLATGSTPINMSAVNWNAVNWNAVNWNAVNWNAVNWNAVNWTGISWTN